MTDEVRQAANILWRYMHVGNQPGSADCLVVLGSRDDRVAEYARQLSGQFAFKAIVITGGNAQHNVMLRTQWQEATEAEHFAAIMQRKGSVDNLLLEKQATNTGQNARYTYELLKTSSYNPKSLLIVTKPYMERRALATFEKQWPDKETILAVTSPPFELKTYCNDEQPIDSVLDIMVGDMQRIIEYPAKGFLTAQPLPDEVMAAYMLLVNAGFNKQHL